MIRYVKERHTRWAVYRKKASFEFTVKDKSIFNNLDIPFGLYIVSLIGININSPPSYDR